MMRRALEIIVKLSRSIEHPHHHLNGAINNYAALLQAIGQRREQNITTLREIVPEIFS